MSLSPTRPIVALVILVVVIIAGIFGSIWLYQKLKPTEPVVTPDVEVVGTKYEIIGKSVQGRDIEAFSYGDGDINLLFVGGIHGGYEWNSVLLAYQFMDYLEAKPEAVPANVTVTIVPSANPDGLYDVVGHEGRIMASSIPVNEDLSSGKGRFNANGVDLNRNFDCKWKPESTWRTRKVSAGTSAFSEPEAKAIRDLVARIKPSAAVFWHSQANAVYASECLNGILPETLTVMNTYASAAGYPAVQTFDSYEVTGDVEGWLASVNIPAITVELKTHQDVEWEKNLAGFNALLNHYGSVGIGN